MPGALPKQITYIVGTEACERFSYYGMVSILTLYLGNVLHLGNDRAKEVHHLFGTAVYFLPLLGGWLADRWLGRYRTILSLSLFYCLGHGALALFEGTRAGTYVGLGLIALGAGGIKPCVSAFVGDQFRDDEEVKLRKVYGLFYWSINLGALFAFALIPLTRDRHGYAWAFAVPGIFMGLATLIFWAGRRGYTIKPPIGKNSNEPAADKWLAIRRIILIFLPIPIFWALYNQIHTSWVIQGTHMIPFQILGFKVDAERIQSSAALFVLFWVPVLTLGAYPLVERFGLRASPLRRMGLGMFLAVIAFVICAMIQSRIDGGQRLSLAWQIVPFTILAAGEVMISATALEFAFSQAPPSLKSTIMSLWLMTMAGGHFLVALITRLNAEFIRAKGSAEFQFYAVLMLAAAVVFVCVATRYRERVPVPAQPASAPA